MERRMTLAGDYRLTVEEKPLASPAALPAAVPLGVMSMGAGKNDLLSVDAWAVDPKGGKVKHYGEEEPLKSYLVSTAGGCSGKKSAAGLPETSEVPVPGACTWVAVKNRFFVTAVCGMAVYVADQLKDRDGVLSIYVDSAPALVRNDTSNGQNAVLFLKVYDRVYYRTDRYVYSYNLADVEGSVEIGKAQDRFVPVVINYIPDNTSWVLVDGPED